MRKLLGLAVGIAVMWLNTACGGTAAPPQPTIIVPTGPLPASPEQTVQVRLGDALLMGEDSPGRQLLLAQVQRFEELNPEIDLVLEPWGWNPKIFADQLTAGNIPDVMEIAATEGSLVIPGGYAADLTELMAQWPVTQDFNENILAPYVRDQRIYAVPRVVYIMGLFYDKKLFAEAGLVDGQGEPSPPTTWEELVTAAKTITATSDAAGFCILTQFNQGGWNFMNWGWQAGGEFERFSDGRWQATFDEAPIIEAMDFIKALRWEYDVLQDDLQMDGGKLLPLIASHKCGMAIIVPDSFDVIANEYDGNPDDLGLTVLPAGPGGVANLMGGGYTMINAAASPAVQAAAFKWATWRGFDPESLEIELQAPAGRSRWAFSNRSLMYRLNSPTARQERALVEKYRFQPYYHIHRTYFEQASQHARPEPAVAVQELYAVLDEIIQTVLINSDADPASLLHDAAQKFQTEHLQP
ncbi:MAG: hypothetical protein FOGNACKC_04338 [Anaerolineae bacterium]|nr:hypothetical protein [Anaerolineae bacterium]